MSGIREFTKKYLVTIVMVPSIICKLKFLIIALFNNKFPHNKISLLVTHMGWMKLQDIDAFVKPDEKKDYPFISIFHKIHSSSHIDSNIRKFVHSPD